MPELAVRGVEAELAIDHWQRRQDRGVVGTQYAEPYELEEARVYNRPLVDRGAAVGDRVGGARVRVAVDGESQEVRGGREGPVRGYGPVIELGAPVIRRGAVLSCRGTVAVVLGDLRRADEAGDLRADACRRMSDSPSAPA